MKQHHSLTVGWTYLGPLQSNKEGARLNDMVLCLHIEVLFSLDTDSFIPAL